MTTSLKRPEVQIRRVLPTQTVLSPLGQVTQCAQVTYFRAGRPWRRRRIFGSFAAVYLLDGDGAYEDDLGRQDRIEAGDLILVFPDLAHRYTPGARGWTELFLVFSGSVFDAWLAQGVLRVDRPILRLMPIDHWRQRMESILAEPTEPAISGVPGVPGEEMAIQEVCRMQQLLADMLAGQGKPQGSGWLARAQGALARGESPQAVARAMHLSYSAFRRRFAQEAGVSPGRYRAHRLIDRACQLIAAGELSDKQIAEELGFCDAFHFSKRFRQLTGQSPTQLRRSLPFARG